MNWKRGAVIASVVSAGLLVSACGQIGAPTASLYAKPVSVTIPKTPTRQPIPISAIATDVQTALRADYGLKHVVVGEAPAGVTGLQAFLDNPTSATASNVHGPDVNLGAPGWNLETNLVQMPVFSSKAAEMQAISSMVRSDIGTFPAKIRKQIASSPVIYIDFTYSRSGLDYVLFWWGPIGQ